MVTAGGQVKVPAPLTRLRHLMANVAGVRDTTDTTRRTDTGGWGAPWEWVVSAAVTLVVCLIGIGSSPLWQDELATWSATNRSLPELARLSAHKDAVLTPYYALMHVWTSVVGFTPVSLRLLSAIAMSAAAGVLAALGARLWGRGRGLFAGFMLAALPAVSYYGQEARPYALVVLGAVAGTAALVGALADARRGLWAAYAGCLIALGALQLTALTLVAAHGVTAWHDAWRRGCRWPRQWLIASGGALAVLSPLLIVGRLSRRQVAWIDAISVETLASLPGLFGIIGVAVVVVALAGIGVVRSPANASRCRAGRNCPNPRATNGVGGGAHVSHALRAIHAGRMGVIIGFCADLAPPVAGFGTRDWDRDTWARRPGGAANYHVRCISGLPRVGLHPDRPCPSRRRHGRSDGRGKAIPHRPRGVRRIRGTSRRRARGRQPDLCR